MQINLLNTIKSQIGDNIIQKAANFIGESDIATKKALEIALPSILGGVTNQSSESNSVNSLLTKFKDGEHDGSIFNTIENLLGGGSATQGLLDAGESIVNGLFDNKTSSIVDWIAAFTGIKTGSASSLMNMAAPLVMGAIGKQVVNEKMDGFGLSNLLNSQKSLIENALPAGLASVLGLSNFKKSTPSVFGNQRELEPPVAFEKIDTNPWMHKVLPWAVLLFVGFVGLMFLRTCKSANPEPPTVIAVPDVVPAQVPVVDSTATIKLPEGNITVKKGSFLDELNKEMSDNTLDPTKALTFDNVNFATGSAILTEGSITQLLDLVKIMRLYPKVAIKIEGHTDNKGYAQSNKKLSLNRAESVIKFLQTNGIEANRMTAEGLGSDKPKADNTTEEGRAKNRRIEAYVVKK
jgi:OmpA-OmpF porin, OOP family